MLTLPSDIRILMALAPIDMRRSFDGLSAVIVETLQHQPISGDLFLFRSKGGDRIKALVWDRNGLVIWYKRLEAGRFKWPQRDAVVMELSSHELTLLLDGIDFTRLKRLPTVQAQVAC